MTMSGGPSQRQPRPSWLSLAALVAALAAAVAVWISLPQTARAADDERIAPATAWLSLDETTALQRIALGSCLDQAKAQPIWKAVLQQRPQLFIMMGDNVYGDGPSADLRELRQAYAVQARQPELAEVRASIPFLRIWDDHDYGLNDGGASFAHKAKAAELFHEFWQSHVEAPEGLYHSRTYGPSGQRVQIVMLDTRWFRSPLKARTESFPHPGRYEPDDDPAKTMLGEAQWTWLERELTKPAGLRIVVSSIQVLAEGHGYERWGNLPRERDRLLRLIDATKANGVILLSGDRHSGAFYKLDRPGSYPLVELTSSSPNRPYGPPKDSPSPERVSELYHRANFGLITIDWQARTLDIALKRLGGEDAATLALRFADLGLGP
jgi:alkaline phosphatase D